MKPKLTPEQKKEQRLWKAADKACRALLESNRNVVRISSLHFDLKRGITLQMSYDIRVEFKAPKVTKRKTKAGAWTFTTPSE